MTDRDEGLEARPPDRKIRLLVEVTVPEIHASRTTPRLAADALQRVLAGGYSAQVEAFHDLAPWWETAKVTVGAWTHTAEEFPDGWADGPAERAAEGWDVAGGAPEEIRIPMAGADPKLLRVIPSTLGEMLEGLPEGVWVKLHTADPADPIPAREDGGLRFVLDGRLRLVPITDPEGQEVGQAEGHGGPAEMVWTYDEGPMAPEERSDG